MATNYSPYNKKRTSARFTPNKGTTIGSGLLKSVGPTSPAPASSPKISGPAPPSLQGESDRIDAGANYNTSLSSVNNQLMSAALRYGGAPQVQQFGYDPAGGDTSSLVGVSTNPDDNSALSTIARNATLAAKGIDQSQNAQNTFFSSNRLNELQQNQDNAGRQRLAAQKEYEDAVAELMNNLLAAQTARNSTIRNAGITDIQASEAVAPPAAVPQAGPTSPAAKPKSGFKFVQNTGTRKGLSYNLVPGRDGKLWRKYENGELIPRG